MITLFSAPVLRAFQNELIDHMRDYCASRGVRINASNSRFTTSTAKITLDVELMKPQIDNREANFKALAEVYGLDPDWYGQTVRMGSKMLTIADLDTRKPKNPVILHGEDGRRYKCTVAAVAAAMKMK